MMNYGYCRSILDGTEVLAGSAVVTISIPSSYLVPNTTDHIIDQGARPICVSAALSEIVRWDCNNKGIKCNISDSVFYDLSRIKSDEGMMPKEALEILINNRILPTSYTTYARVTSSEVAKKCIYQYGPIMVALPVKSERVDFWNGNDLLGGHMVLLVGYDEDSFILKNSWGYSYGDNGISRFPVSDFNKVYESWSVIM